ncbi:molybdate ABC transporter substrate-binding protein [Mycolicibacterium sp. 018/SC-01/001]|uniref:molybdate ABC transporter substrate-binding protein n=1 Tax=Mycolicibacterium sp. 018/SC-01/001 TaxID=2592069 RepID=UPI001180EE75|nr:molybdate ABC transporter substrate-binding protein [Mycolicibacterium sp. 018/SC-01/001]TRW84963.1 molybdate ABC transporter substrate-binding protein [Mycolicibacterium sp. 018/SC-01/001]
MIVVGCSSPQTTNGITVFAAASLKTVFTDLGAEFEKDHPGTTVTFSFAGSSDLVTQLTQGAAADVFASADTATMDKAVSAGLVSGAPVNFATNRLTIVTPPGNPSRVGSFADLARPGTQVVVCAPQVPCGAATERLEKITGVTLRPVSEESSVTDVLGKITSGQADAGLVYTTDARSAGTGVDTIAIAESARAVNTYPIALLDKATDTTLARQFVDLITGPRGRDTLAAAGFSPP